MNKMLSEMSFSFALRTDSYIEPQILLGGRLNSPSAGNITSVKVKLNPNKQMGLEINEFSFEDSAETIKTTMALVSLENEQVLLPQDLLETVKEVLKRKYLMCKIDLAEFSCKIGAKFGLNSSSDSKPFPYLGISLELEKEIRLKNFFKDNSINADNMKEKCSKSFCKTNIGLSIDKNAYLGASLLRDYLWNFNIKQQKVQFAELNVYSPPHEEFEDNYSSESKGNMSEAMKNFLRAILFFSIIAAGLCLARIGHFYIKRNIERILVQTTNEESQPVKGFKWAWSTIRKGREKNDGSLNDSTVTQDTFAADNDNINRTEVYREKARIFDQQDDSL